MEPRLGGARPRGRGDPSPSRCLTQPRSLTEPRHLAELWFGTGPTWSPGSLTKGPFAAAPHRALAQPRSLTELWHSPGPSLSPAPPGLSRCSGPGPCPSRSPSGSVRARHRRRRDGAVTSLSSRVTPLRAPEPRHAQCGLRAAAAILSAGSREMEAGRGRAAPASPSGCAHSTAGFGS